MPLPALALPLLLSGGSFLGGLFKRPQSTNQTNTTSGSNNQSGLSQFSNENTSSGLSRPVYDAMQGNLRDSLLQSFLGRISDSSVDDLVKGNYFANLRSINDNSGRLKENIREQFANRGLSFSPATAIAESNVDANRFANTINLEGSLPGLRDQIISQRLGDASGFLSSLPVATATDQVAQQNGQTATSSNTNFNQTSTGQGSSASDGGFGGGIQSLITTLAGLMGDGAFSKKSATPVIQPNRMSFGSTNPNFRIPTPFVFNSGVAR